MAKKRKGGRLGSAAVPIDPSEETTQPSAPPPAPPVSQKVTVEPLPLAQVTVTPRTPTTLASRVADAAAAQLLIFDELPADEKPRPGDRVLLVGIVWGDSTLVELEQIWTGGDLPVSRLFDLPSMKLPKNFPIVKHDGADHVLSLPDDVHAEIHRSGEVKALPQVGRRIEAPFRGSSHKLGPDDRIVAQISPQLTLIARYVRAARQRDRTLLESLDIPFASTVLVALLALGLFFLMVSITPRSDDSYSDDLNRNQQRFTKYQVKPPEKTDQPRFKDLSGAKEGEKSKGEEGKLGKEEARKKEADPSKKGTPEVDPNKKAKDLAKIKKLGLIAALSKMGVGGGSAASNVLGPGGLGSGINNSLGGTRGGAGLGDAYGVGGMGTRGTGAGGGGNALGIGGLGTRGSGHGRGGYGEIDLGGRGKEDTIFVPGHTTVVGGLSREVINRVIQKHMNEIKYCYEKELTKDPGLYGKITVLFMIEGTGRVGEALVQQTTMASEPVESCIVNHVRRWMFPSPQGGGTVQVTYPYVFKPSGQ
ncbi:MAG: AgmX/PglI C-terminal domain-containing protein [Myxococcales bacterium]